MNKSSETTPNAHFGYQKVSKEEKQQKVSAVFHSVAEKYDLMNDLMSLGIHRLWKRYTVSSAAIRPGQCVLDLAGGSGDLTLHLAKRTTKTGHVVLADINSAMLSVGRDKVINQGLNDHVTFVQADAEMLPFADNFFHCVVIGFGLRNVTDQNRALASMWRVLKPGGRLLILEFSKPVFPLLQSMYDRYSFSVLPKLGQWFSGDAESYRYLVESIRMHPDQQTLGKMMGAQGFQDWHYQNLSGGIVALHTGYKY